MTHRLLATRTSNLCSCHDQVQEIAPPPAEYLGKSTDTLLACHRMSARLTAAMKIPASEIATLRYSHNSGTDLLLLLLLFSAAAGVIM